MTLLDNVDAMAEEARLEREKAKAIEEAKKQGAEEAKEAEKRHEEAKERGMI